MIAVRRGWIPRFAWWAAVVAPIAIGLLIYATAT
jgi:hypothetical protein